MKSGRAEKPEEQLETAQSPADSPRASPLLCPVAEDYARSTRLLLSAPGLRAGAQCCWCCLPALPALGRSAAMRCTAPVPLVTFGLSSSCSSPAGRHGAMCESILYVWFSTQPTRLLPHLNDVRQAVYLMLERSEPESLIC